MLSDLDMFNCICSRSFPLRCRPLRSYVAVWCGVICCQAQLQQHLVVTTPHESDAPFVRVVDFAELQSSHANLLRRCRVVSKGHHYFDTGWGRQWTRLSGGLQVLQVLRDTNNSVPRYM